MRCVLSKTVCLGCISKEHQAKLSKQCLEIESARDDVANAFDRYNRDRDATVLHLTLNDAANVVCRIKFTNSLEQKVSDLHDLWKQNRVECPHWRRGRRMTTGRMPDACPFRLEHPLQLEEEADTLKGTSDEHLQ